MLRLRKPTVVGLLCLPLLTTPSAASARVVVTVEFAYGGLAAGGIGFFLYAAGSWELPFTNRDVPGALLEFSNGRARLGLPIPSPRLDDDAADDTARGDMIQIELLRWRF